MVFHNAVAHGMDGSLVAPDWPPLTLPEADDVLRHYPEAASATEILTQSPRPFSAAGLVASPLGSVFIKRHHQSVRSRSDLMEEHRFIGYLQGDKHDKNGSKIPCSKLVKNPLLNSDGESITTLGDWVYEVHPVAQGIDVYERALSWTPFLSAGHALSAGRALASLHTEAQGYDAPRRETRPLVSSFTIFAGPGGDSEPSPPSRMLAYLEQRPALQQYAERRDWQRSFDTLLMPFYAELEPWLPHLESLWTHNDLHASNMTWSGSENDAHVEAIIDFGLSDRTNAMYDLATTIERNVVEWLRIGKAASSGETLVHYDHLDSLIRGYEKITPLTYEEARGLVAMLPLVHCEFALSETDYFLSILHSGDKAYLGYEGYFLGHAQWFKSAPGRELSDHLRRWAEEKPRSGRNGS